MGYQITTIGNQTGILVRFCKGYMGCLPDCFRIIYRPTTAALIASDSLFRSFSIRMAVTTDKVISSKIPNHKLFRNQFRCEIWRFSDSFEPGTAVKTSRLLLMTISPAKTAASASQTTE
jgi:hypothetical protein